MDRKKTVRLSPLKNAPNIRLSQSVVDSQLNPIGRPHMRLMPLTSTKPSSAKPSSAKPSSAKPSSAKPSSAKPSSAKPSSAKPSSAKPSSAKPSSAKPSSRSSSSRSSSSKHLPPPYDPKLSISVLSQNLPNIEEYFLTSREDNRRLYPQKVLAIYYITVIFENMIWFITHFKGIVTNIKEIEQLHGEKYLRDHITYDLHELHKKIEKKIFKYTSVKVVKGVEQVSEYDIAKDYTNIRLLARPQINISTEKNFHILSENNFHKDLKIIMKEDKYSLIKIFDMSNELFHEAWGMSAIKRQETFYKFNKKNGFINRIVKRLNHIDSNSIKLKLEAQYDIMQEFINILNSLWKDDSIKEEFNKFILVNPSPLLDFFQKGSGFGLLGTIFDISASRKDQKEDNIKLIYMYRRANFDNFYKIYEHLNSIYEFIKYKTIKIEKEYGNVEEKILIYNSKLNHVNALLEFIAKRNLENENDLNEIYPLTFTV